MAKYNEQFDDYSVIGRPGRFNARLWSGTVHYSPRTMDFHFRRFRFSQYDLSNIGLTCDEIVEISYRKCMSHTYNRFIKVL